MTLDVYTVSHILEHYHKPGYRIITDYEKVVANAEELTENGMHLTKYECPGQTIYLNDEGYPVTIDRQKVDIEKNAYFYRWTDEDVDEDVAFEYVAPYEYMKNETP